MSEYRVEVGVFEGGWLILPKILGRRLPPPILGVGKSDASTFHMI